MYGTLICGNCGSKLHATQDHKYKTMIVAPCLQCTGQRTKQRIYNAQRAARAEQAMLQPPLWNPHEASKIRYENIMDVKALMDAKEFEWGEEPSRIWWDEAHEITLTEEEMKRKDQEWLKAKETEKMNMEHLLKGAEEESEAQQTDSLLVITSLAADYQALQKEYKDLEEQTKAAKKAFNKVSQEDIPNAMMEVGLSEIKLSDGKKVSFKEDVSCSVKDYSKLDDFLSARGEEGMMKMTLDIGKVPRNILQMILKELSDTFDIDAIPKQFVHPATMAAYVRRLCGINGQTEAQLSVAEIDETMLSVYRYYKTTIK